MKVLVTGASGYIGKHVVKAFLNAGYDVYVSDFTYKGMDDRAKIIDVPIFSGEKNIYQLLECPDILIHLAWRNGFKHNSETHMRDLSDHVTFLENMVEGGLPSLTVMGSMHEIGYYEGAVTENTPCNPLSMYGIAKNALRQSLTLYCENRDVTMHWLRGFYIFGDDMRGSSIFAKLWQAVEDGKKVFPFTTGRNRYDFIHIDELAQQIMCASIQNKVSGIINVCTGQPVSLAEKVETYIKEHHMDIELEYGAFPERPYDSPAIWGDNSKIREIMENAKNETKK